MLRCARDTDAEQAELDLTISNSPVPVPEFPGHHSFHQHLSVPAAHRRRGF
jgi:hypothetical protein